VQSTGVVRELPRKGQSGVQAYTVATQENEGWELIRIEVSTRDLKNKSRYCNEENKEIKKYDGELYKCRDKEDVLGVDTMKKFEDIIIPAAMKLHEDRLFVRRGSGKLRVPQFQDESYCKHFTVPDEHHSDGVDNADFVLYVAAVPLSSFGVTCAVENSTGRPIVGAVNYAPTTYEYMRFDVRRVAQLIAHALGFNLPEMERKGIVTEVELRGAKRKVVNSSKTVEKAQKHYNCSNLKGMELGTKGDDTRVYWLRHIARDELMTPMSVYNYGAGYYTALTMALFEDLQYYKANWGMEEQMSWGNQSGCDFLHKWCIVENKVRYPEYFCNETIFRCRSDRLAYAPCSVPASMIVVPEDICHTSGDYPYVDRSGNHLTTYYCDDNTTDEVAGSIMGPDSFCLDAEELKIEGAANAILNQNGVCARVLCDYEKRTVSVKYNGSDTFKECPEGSSIDVKSSVFESGKIKCPKYDEVCIIAFNGSSRVPFVVNRPPASSAAAEESASSVDTSLQKDQENKE
ncbi:surface protease GP63, partial [Trypanosoma theileri]